jgi:hypothetical protein
MTTPAREPRNPFYFLLLAACVVFVGTCLAYVVMPWLEDKAAEMGQPAPPSTWRAMLREDGWIWLFTEVGVIAVLSVCAMGLDRIRSLRRERAGGETPSLKENTSHETPPVTSGG